MKKKIIMAAVGILAVMAMTACGGNSKSAATEKVTSAATEKEGNSITTEAPASASKTGIEQQILVDAERMKGFEIDQKEYLKTFSVLWDDRTFSFTEKNGWKVYQANIALKRFELPTSLVNSGGKNPAHVTVQGCEYTGMDTGEDVYVECFDEYTEFDEQKFEKLDETTFFAIEKDEFHTEYILYKLVKKEETKEETEEKTTEGAEEAEEKMIEDFEEAENEKAASEMYREIVGEALTSESEEEIEDYSNYAEYEVVSMEIAVTEEYTGNNTEEDFRKELLSLSECIGGDSGAPYMQDIVSCLNWGGISIKDSTSVYQMYQGEYINEISVAIDKEQAFPEKNIYLSYNRYGEGDLEGVSYERRAEKKLSRGQEEISLLGRTAILDTESKLILMVDEEGMYCFTPDESADMEEIISYINENFIIE